MRWLSLALALFLIILWPALQGAGAADPIVLDLPLDCTLGETCAIQQYVDHDASAAARDYQCGSLSYDGHNGTDFRLLSRALQRAGVNVLAAADGLVLRLRANVEDVIIAPNDTLPVSDRMCGNGLVIAHRDGWETQYCHLAKDSLSVRPGQRVTAGTPLGRVGLSGATQFPHLHFTVRHQGEIVDPFAFAAPAGSCGGGVPLWRQSWRAALAYRARSVLNAGFAASTVTMEAIEDGNLSLPPSADPAALVAYVRSIGLKAQDVQDLAIRAPDGALLVAHTAEPLARNQAQSLVFVGKRRPREGWPAGAYEASYRVTAGQQLVLERRFFITLGPGQSP
jgi:hypothetical protein